jgi:hypothetical protein
LPDLTRLLNDPIYHDPHWPPISNKFPSNILKFESKPNEDLDDHVTTFYLWCSSNSLRDDSIELRLSQFTLIGSAEKWYIELKHLRYSTFGKLEMDFLNHFQLPVRYDTSIKLLANFEQTKEDHISDHIREWRCWKSLIKVPVPPAFLLEWFLKSLVPQLSKDIATSGVFSTEDVIMKAQQLELIYS